MILALFIIIPLVGGLLCWLSEARHAGMPRWIALFTMLIIFTMGLQLSSQGDFSLSDPSIETSRWQAELILPWIPRFGISFHLGVDGLSLLMVLLTGGIGIAAVLCSWREITKNVGFFYLCLLWNISGVLGVFLALDLFLFFVCWELMLIPIYFLIIFWGHRSEEPLHIQGQGQKTREGRIYAANKFFIYTQASGLLLLISILLLVFFQFSISGTLSFDYNLLLDAHLGIEPEWEMLVMLGFFIAFAVKLPIVPLHSWLPDVHEHTPISGSVDITGILLKTSAYGMLRFALPLFPHASQQFAPIAMLLGLVTLFYGAIMACAQTDTKRLVAYSSVSHMGFILIGIYAGSLISLQGVVVQMLAHGISAGALFILCGQLYERLQTRDLRQMGGLWSRIAWLPAITLFFAAASLGLPGLGNFVGEFLILLGAFKNYPWIISIATVGLILAVVYSLMMIQKAFYGTPRQATSQEPLEGQTLPGLSARELGLMLVLMTALVVLGFFPQPILTISEPPMQSVLNFYSVAGK